MIIGVKGALITEGTHKIVKFQFIIIRFCEVQRDFLAI